MIFKDYLEIILSLLTLGAIVFAIYRTFADPDITAKNRLDVMTQTCGIKHHRIDEVLQEMKEHFKSIDERFKLLQENDIKHIESEMRRLSDVQTKILTILEYQEKNK